jgi:hypothetical protein
MATTTNLPATRQGMALMAPEQDIFAWAQAMIQHKLVPEGLNTPEKVILCVCAGREFGISPLQSVNDFYVVKGRVGGMTQFMVSCLRRAGHRLIFNEQTMEKATVTITRRDGQSNTVTVTYQEANAAHWDQYWDDEKKRYESKPTWLGQGRKTMLTYRAASINIRQFCPEVLRRSTGEVMATADEIADGHPDGDGEIERLRDENLHVVARLRELEAENKALIALLHQPDISPPSPAVHGDGKRILTLGEMDEAKRAEFMAGACAYYGFTTTEVLLALAVADLTQVEVSPWAAKERISAWVEAKAAEKARSEPESAESAPLNPPTETQSLWPQ